MFEEEITIQLSKPVIIGTGTTEQTYTELVLREPTAGEIEKATRADTPAGSAITLISLITKIPRTAIERISKRDLVAANKFLEGFTDAGNSAAGQS
jgi:hypothetical protein